MTDNSAVKILIADDNDEVLGLMQDKVQAAGYTVVLAHDGQDAWEKIQAEDPDVILLDLMMPKLDGFAVLQYLRQQPSSKKFQPVIIVSGKNDLTDMQQGFALEADHYIAKPCSVEDVLKAIQLMINLIPQRRTAKELIEER